MKIYVASSWKNKYQPGVVAALRSAGYEVYDFRNPRPGDNGFHWSEIDPNWQSWSPEQYREALKHPLAQAGFDSDFAAMKWADVFIGVAPFGRSASMEMGYAVGASRLSILYMPEPLGEWELMVKMFGHICLSMDEVLAVLDESLKCSDCKYFRETYGWPEHPDWCDLRNEDISSRETKCELFKPTDQTDGTDMVNGVEVSK